MKIHKLNPRPIIGCLFTSLLTISQASVTVDFSGATDFADNFRFVSSGGTTPTATQSGGFVSVTSGSPLTGSATVNYAYDANGPVAGETTFNSSVIISADFYVENAGNFGLWVRGVGDTTTFVVVSPNNSGSNDLVRIGTGGSAATNTLGTLTTISSATDLGFGLGNTFTTLAIQYYENALSPGNALMDISVGSGNFTGLAAGTYFSEYEIGFRAFDAIGAGTTSFDNLSINPIPEPSVTLLGGLAALCLQRRRRG